MNLTRDVIRDLRALVGERGVMTEPKVLAAMSQDHYWFSPVLKPQLADKLAEVIVQPNTVEELVGVVALAYERDLPVTTRGSGTGNYGQGMPMQGGVVLSTHGLKEILELTPERARVEAGVRLGTLEREARLVGAELRMYPSTFMTATAGGFLAGGAGGVGSVTWGTLWDEGNVLAATVVTMEREPKMLEVEGHEALQERHPLLRSHLHYRRPDLCAGPGAGVGADHVRFSTPSRTRCTVAKPSLTTRLSKSGSSPCTSGPSPPFSASWNA